MISTYFKIELKIIFRKKLYLVMSIFLPVVFYLLFTSILDMPEEAKLKFYKEYMYSMTVFSLMNFCLLSFPLDLIEERNQGWYKRLMVTPLSSFQYYLVKISKTMCQFFNSNYNYFFSSSFLQRCSHDCFSMDILCINFMDWG